MLDIASELTMLAVCWQVVRMDGVALGFTTHDRALVIAGMHYTSAPGMLPSAVVRGDGVEVDTMEVAGALSDDAITADDLAAGRYDGAAVRVFMVDWRSPDAGLQPLARGVLGSVEAGVGADAGFAAVLRGPTAALAVTRVETCSPECRAELGDWRCRVAMRGRMQRRVVVESSGGRLRVAGVAADDYLAGRVRVMSGVSAGLSRRVIAVEAGWLVLDEALAMVPGVMVELREGCDKRFATCVERFGNGANFRGEPHVPGGDLLTRFGGF